MRSRGLPTTVVPALLKLEALGRAGGTQKAICGRDGGEWLFVGSEAECVCFAAGRATVRGLRELELGLVQTDGEGVAAIGRVGVGGHSGLFGSWMGLEIVRLSMADLERLKLNLLLLLIESVSLVKEKARVLLIRGVAGPFPRGGVRSPKGTRSSTSLLDRFSDLKVAASSIFTRGEDMWRRAQVVVHSGGAF